MTESDYTISVLWTYLVLQVFLFIYTRMYQKRYNKNIGVSLVQIAAVVQLVVITMHNREQLHVKSKTGSVHLDHLGVLVAGAGLCALLSIAQVAVVVTKVLNCAKLPKRFMLSRIIVN